MSATLRIGDLDQAVLRRMRLLEREGEGAYLSEERLVREIHGGGTPCPIYAGRHRARINRLLKRGLLCKSMAGFIMLSPAGREVVP